MNPRTVASERGERLRQARLGARLSQQDAAKGIGMSKQWVSQVEKGAPIWTHHLQGLALLYRTTADYIIFGNESRGLSAEAFLMGSQFDTLSPEMKDRARLMWKIMGCHGAQDPPRRAVSRAAGDGGDASPL